MSCMAIGRGTRMLDFDIYMKIGAVAQCVNVLVTLLYFGTRLPQRMMCQADIDAVSSARQDVARLQLQEYTRLVENREQSSTASAAIDDIEKQVDREIKLYGGRQDLQLKLFGMKEKFELRRHLMNRFLSELRSVF